MGGSAQLFHDEFNVCMVIMLVANDETIENKIDSEAAIVRKTAIDRPSSATRS